MSELVALKEFRVWLDRYFDPCDSLGRDIYTNITKNLDKIEKSYSDKEEPCCKQVEEGSLVWAINQLKEGKATKVVNSADCRNKYLTIEGKILLGWDKYNSVNNNASSVIFLSGWSVEEKENLAGWGLELL
jgi:hypothetical protein